jgi:hypothetical protein
MCGTFDIYAISVSTKRMLRVIIYGHYSYNDTRKAHLHFKDTITLLDTSTIGSTAFQDSRDMLKRGVEVTADTLEGAPFTDLSSHIKTKPRVSLGDGNDTGSTIVGFVFRITHDALDREVSDEDLWV